MVLSNVYHTHDGSHGAGIYANIKGVYWWDPCGQCVGHQDPHRRQGTPEVILVRKWWPCQTSRVIKGGGSTPNDRNVTELGRKVGKYGRMNIYEHIWTYVKFKSIPVISVMIQSCLIYHGQLTETTIKSNTSSWASNSTSIQPATAETLQLYRISLHLRSAPR